MPLQPLFMEIILDYTEISSEIFKIYSKLYSLWHASCILLNELVKANLSELGLHANRGTIIISLKSQRCQC